jgi:hypothetical protein
MIMIGIKNVKIPIIIASKILFREVFKTYVQYL